MLDLLQTTGSDRHGLILEKDGTRYAFDRLASKDADGLVPLRQLRDDEVVAWPGVIYRKMSAP
jgi:hypothetical protein